MASASPALAELELAVQLIRVGARVTFLPESQARTADLECRLGRERFFVEITAMVGSAERQRLPLRGLMPDEEGVDETDRGVILIHRILARIQQKAKQLADYSSPVVLCISIPRADLRGEHTSRSEGHLARSQVPGGSRDGPAHETARGKCRLDFVLGCVPMPAKAGTRLANVEMVERSTHQRGHPRVRMLIKNPAASAHLSERQQDAFCHLL